MENFGNRISRKEKRDHKDMNYNGKRKYKRKKNKFVLTKRGRIIYGLVLAVLILSTIITIRSFYNSSKNIKAEYASVTGDIISISPKISGKIAALEVKSGDVVSENEVLFTLDTELLKNQVDEAYAEQQLAFERLERAGGGLKGELNNQAKSSTNNTVNQTQGQSSGKEELLTQLRTAQDKYNSIVLELEKYKYPVNDFLDVSYASKKLKKELKNGLITSRDYNQKLTKLKTARKLRLNISALNQKLDKLSTGEGNKQHTAVSKSTQDNGNITMLQNAVKAAQSKYNLAKLALNNSSILAPANGTIIESLAHVGDFVSPEHGVMSLVDFKNLNITAYITGQELNRIKSGASAKITIKTISGKTFLGTVTEVGKVTAGLTDQISTQSLVDKKKLQSLIPITIGFNYSGEQLVPGLEANVSIKAK